MPQHKRHILILVVIFLAMTCSQVFAFSLSGKVYGGSNLLPNAGVILIDPSTGDQLGATTTDGAGSYAFTVDSGTYDLIVSAPEGAGFSNAPVAGIIVTTSDVIQDVILISGANVLSGIVRGVGGVPVGNITVNVNDQASGTQVGSLVTNATGSYSFALAPGIYEIDVQRFSSGSIDSHPKKFVVWPQVSNLEISGDLAYDLNLPFVTLSGKTTDSNGVPVAGVQVKADDSWSDTSTGSYQYRHVAHDVLSDATGAYSIVLLAGLDSLSLIPPEGSGLSQTVFNGLAITNDTTRDFALPRANVLSGVVRGVDGAPISNVGVKVNDQASGTQVGSLVTNATGSYSFALAPGIYEIDVQSSGSSSNITRPKTFAVWPLVANLEISSDLAYDLNLPFVILSGKTTDSNGVPVAGVQIKAADSWGEYITGFFHYRSVTNDVFSDATGAYSIVLLAGLDFLSLIPPEGSGLSQTVFNGLAITNDTTRDFALPRANVLSGIVRGVGGVPVSNITVNVNDQASGNQVGSLVTNATGSYSFALAPGIYEIDVQRFSSSSIDSHPKKFVVWPQVSNLEISGDLAYDLNLPFVTLSGKTTDSNGVPVAGVQVKADDSWADYSTGSRQFKSVTHNVFSDATGAYSIVLLTGLDSEAILPPLESGFAQTVINGLNVQENKLQNIILSFIDDVPPVILSGPTVTSLTDTTAVIEWQTDEKATGEVRFGLNSPPSSALAETTPSTIHSQVLSGLTPDSDYFVQVTGSDPVGNGPVVSTVVSFHTKPLPDSKAPVIIAGPIVTAIGHDSAVVQWRTDEPSNGSLAYGLTEGLGSSESSGLATNHQVTLTSLGAATLYYLQVSSVDTIGNGPSLSPVLSFTTVAAPDMTAPMIVEGPMILNISDTGATVFWTTNEPATSGVSYNDGTAYGVYQDDALVTEHIVKLTSLSASTLYELTVSTKDGQGNGPTLDGPNSFATLAASDVQPPVIIESPVVVNITHQSVVIRWSTDEPADGVIEYGLAADQLTETESHAMLKKPHNMTITGLEAGTEYFFRVLSTDAYGNGSMASAVYSFMTEPEPNTNKPQLTKELEVIHNTDDDQLTIAWETDEPTDTVLEYNELGQIPSRSSKAEKELKHQVTLKGLKPDTAYEIVIAATDIDGNTTLAKLGDRKVLVAFIGDMGMFTPKITAMTLVAPDITAPVIVSIPRVVGLSDTTATIQWETDEISDSLVRYSQSGGSLNLSAGDIFDVARHAIVLTNLTADTVYEYTVESIDPSGNGPTVSTTYSFTTLAVPDTTAPIITSSPVATVVSSSGATIEWSTDEASSTTINYGTVSGILNQTRSIFEIALDHGVTLTGLTSGTTYYFEVVSTDASENTLTSSELSFTTTGTPPETDADGDGYTPLAGDCNDGDNTIYPGANDSTCNGVDEDCSGIADDSYVSLSTSCGTGACAAAGSTGCVAGVVSDTCTAGTPAASDSTCDNVDDDCNGATDDGYTSDETCFLPGDCASSNAGSTCGVGGVETGCQTGTVSVEICEGSTDENCDGSVDEGCGCTNGDTRATSCGTGACASSGTESCVAGTWSGDTCTAGTPGTEICGDSIDQDCNGADLSCSVVDGDGDGTPDLYDGCPNDPAKTTPGFGGCGVTDSIIQAGTNIVAQPRPEINMTLGGVSSPSCTLSSSLSSNASPPSNFRLIAGSSYEITSDCTFTAPITICLNYNQSAVQQSEANLKLYHQNGQNWEDITTSVDTVNNIVCGLTSSLSPFGVFEPQVVTPPAPTASTKVPVNNGLWLLPSVLTGLYLLRRRKKLSA